MEDLEVGERVILEMILKKCGRNTWTGLVWLVKGIVTRCTEHGDKSLDLKKAEYLI